ncbi:MAG: hypothetical protein ACRDH8_07770 [Actinomycetota bacterium]
MSNGQAQSRNVIARIDPSRKEVEAEIPIAGPAWALAAGEGAVWAGIPLFSEPRAAATGGIVQRIDPVTNSVVATIHVGPYPGPIAAGAGSIWVVAGDASEDSQQLFRIDPESSRVTARVPIPGLSDGYIYDMAMVAGDVWLLQHGSRPGSHVEHNGYVVRIDGETGEIVQVIPAEGIAMAAGHDRIVVIGRIDDRGDWRGVSVARTIDTTEGTSSGPPVPLGQGLSPFAAGPGDVWATGPTSRYGWVQILRLHPETFAVADRVATLGTAIYTDLAWDPAMRAIWVATAVDGSAVLVHVDLA